VLSLEIIFFLLLKICILCLLWVVLVGFYDCYGFVLPPPPKNILKPLPQLPVNMSLFGSKAKKKNFLSG
jgi:hypothetical protein